MQRVLTWRYELAPNASVDKTASAISNYFTDTDLSASIEYRKSKVSKAVPLHAMEALGGEEV
jgi:hypothetical protein